MIWSNHRRKWVLQSIWKGCSLHGNIPDVFQLGASQSLLNTWFSPTEGSHIYEIGQAHNCFIKLELEYLSFIFVFLGAGQAQCWNKSSSTFTTSSVATKEPGSPACLQSPGISPGCLSLSYWDWVDKGTNVILRHSGLSLFFLQLEWRILFNQWAQINKHDPHLGFDFEGIIWAEWEICASFCKSVFVSVLLVPLIPTDHCFLR